MSETAKCTIKEISGTYNKEILKQVTDIHMETFTNFFLTFLGRGFLKRLYLGFCTDSNSGLLIAEHDGVIVGFLAYSEDLSGLYKHLIKKSLIPFAWYSLGAFIRKPSAIFRLFRAFLKPSSSKRNESYIELSSIGVSPNMKNHHIGSLLISQLKQIFDKSRFSYIKLETDADNNEAANCFYVKNGFVLETIYSTPEGRVMNEYRWSGDR